MIEYIDIVDGEDRVIGRATREEIYQKLLPHRIVHVLIFNDKGEMALQLRSDKVSFCPNHWSTTVGGHVQAGESYRRAVERECQEELGAKSKLEKFSKVFFEPKTAPKKFLMIYKTVHNGPFYPETDDVTKIDFFSIDKIQKMVREGEKFHPELLFILEKYFLVI
ncbi:MAG: NUDIX domain-containing protein [Patescibacteria group bacterium]